VRRRVNGSEGSLQFIPENLTDESTRSSSGLGGSASCPINDQWAAMYVFDALVYNEGRTQQRMLYDRSTWELILSDHDNAFANKKGRPGHLENASLDVHAGWTKALGEISDDVIQENFSDILDKRRLKSLELRRDQLLNVKPEQQRRMR